VLVLEKTYMEVDGRSLEQQSARARQLPSSRGPVAMRAALIQTVVISYSGMYLDAMQAGKSRPRHHTTYAHSHSTASYPYPYAIASLYTLSSPQPEPTALPSLRRRLRELPKGAGQNQKQHGG